MNRLWPANASNAPPSMRARIHAHRRIVTTILRDDAAVAVHDVATGDAQVHVVILAGGQFAVESPDRLEYLAPVHHRCVHADVVSLQQRAIGVRLRRQPARNREAASHPPASSDSARTRSAHSGLTWKQSSAGAQRVRQQAVVGVEEDQVLAMALANAGIARSGQSAVGLTHAFYDREARGHAGRVVRANRRRRR